VKDLKNIMIDINLNKLNENLQKEYDELFSDVRFYEKMNREKRINEKVNYINFFLYEIKNGNKNILDIATGPGEFIEVCRYYKNNCLGIDIDTNILKNISDSFDKDKLIRFEKYLKFSKLNVIRQSLNVIYSNFNDCINNNILKNNKYDIINCQLAFHLIFNKNVIYENDNVKWIINDKLKTNFNYFINYIRKHLSNNGIFIFELDKAENNSELIKIIIEITKNKFVLLSTNNTTIYKFKKTNIFDYLKNIVKAFLLIIKK